MLLLPAAGCSGTETAPDRSIPAVGSTLEALGFVEKDQFTQIQLEAGKSASVMHDVKPEQCYMVVIYSRSGRGIFKAGIMDAGNDTVLAQGEGSDVALHFCSETSDAVRIVVQSQSAQELVAGIWEDTGGIPGRDAGSATGGGSCLSPGYLFMGEKVRDDTTGGQSEYFGSCAPGFAAEHVYYFSLKKKSLIEFTLKADFDSLLYVRQKCTEAGTEIVCNDDVAGKSGSGITVTLQPGGYYVFVDGMTGQEGEYELGTRVVEVPPASEACRKAPALEPGRPVMSETRGGFDSFQATCAAGASAADQAYALDVEKTSRVRVYLESKTFDSVLHVRRDCTDNSSEVACNDDVKGSKKVSRLNMVLDKNTYTVIVDGYAAGQSGAFVLMAEVVPVPPAPGTGDFCSHAQSIDSAGIFTGDTIASPDLVKGECVKNPGGPDKVYRIGLEQKTRLTADTLNAEFTPVLSLYDDCTAEREQLACETGSFEAIVEKGEYFLAVEGLDREQFGGFELSLDSMPFSSIVRECRRAAVIRPGREVTGTVEGRDRFRGRCAQTASGPENVYRFKVKRRSLAHVSVTGDFDTVAYIRTQCADAEKEIACSDDAPGTGAPAAGASNLKTVLEPGTYYIFVDSYGKEIKGEYRLNLTLDEI